MANHNLDVAFSSDVTPHDWNLPIAMAYGFTDPDAHNVYKGRGQTKNTLTPDDTVSFWIYDTASSPTTIS